MRRRVWIMMAALGFGAMIGPPAASAARYDTTLMSRADGLHGAVGNESSSGTPAVSADGRAVAFATNATNLAGPGVVVRERGLGITTLVSRDTQGASANSYSFDPAISDDGRFVAFASYATNLSPLDSDSQPDVYVRDRLTSTTTLVSVTSQGVHITGASFAPDISGDGRYVVFSSSAGLVANPPAGQQIYRRDLVSGTTVLVSQSSSGNPANQGAYDATISDDGSRIAFESNSTNLDSADLDADADVFLRDQMRSTTDMVSVAADGSSATDSGDSVLSGDGRSVAFVTESKLDPGDVEPVPAGDVYVRRVEPSATTTWASRPRGVLPPGGTVYIEGTAISDDGRFVAFSTNDPRTIGSDPSYHVMFHDLLAGTTTDVSRASSIMGETRGDNQYPALSDDGRYVAWLQFGALGLDPADDNDGRADIYLRDELGPPPGDSDGDGVFDPSDRCPIEDSRPRDTDGDGCLDPLSDADGDGVADVADRCPAEDARQRDDDHDGCPDPRPDRDRDGVLDSADACPDVNGRARDVNGNGCLDLGVLRPDPRLVPAYYFGRKRIIRNGRYTPRGIKIESFSVRGVPKGTKLRVSCTHRACPTVTKTTTVPFSGTTTFKSLRHARLPKGARLTLVATHEGYLGGEVSYSTNPFRRRGAFCVKPGTTGQRISCAETAP
jgi:Tol biopolymer transport system component